MQASRERQCQTLPRDFRYYGPFEAICEQHQLCYACVGSHKTTVRLWFEFVSFAGLGARRLGTQVQHSLSHSYVRAMPERPVDRKGLLAKSFRRFADTSRRCLSSVGLCARMLRRLHLELSLFEPEHRLSSRRRCDAYVLVLVVYHSLYTLIISHVIRTRDKKRKKIEIGCLRYERGED